MGHLKTQTQPTKEGPLCNVSFKDEATGQERICQTGQPNPAKYERAGLYVCQACYPGVLAYLAKPYGRFGLTAAKKALHHV